MDETKQKIADMVSGMSFERRKPIIGQTKQEFADLHRSLDEIIAKLNKLRLALWHANEKKDYHSTSLDEIKADLTQIRDDIDALAKE